MLLGHGILTLPAYEVMTQRFGGVRLIDACGNGAPINDWHSPVTGRSVLWGALRYGALVAVTHCESDGMGSGNPRARPGERTELGTGQIGIKWDGNGYIIAMHPLQPKRRDWLNRQAISQVEGQWVDLYFDDMQN